MANPFDQFDTPTKGAQAPTKSQSNPFDQFDPAAPAPVQDNTPAAAATQPESTGVAGIATGALGGVMQFGSDAFNAVTNLPSEIAQKGREIKQQYDTGTLTTPEFQQASPLGKAESLLTGFETGAAETGRVLAQIPNQTINTLGAVYDSVAANPVGGNDVDIYGKGSAVSQALTPHTEQGKVLANVAPYLVPGGAAMEGAKLYAMSVKSLQDQGIPLTSENITKAVTENALMLGGGVAAAKGLSVAGEAGRALTTGKASLGTVARSLGEDVDTLYQGGNEAQQNLAKSILSSNGNEDISNAIKASGGDATRAQEALDTTTEAARKQITSEYETHLGQAQKGLNDAGVKTFKLNETNKTINNHLDAGLLEPKTERIIKKIPLKFDTLKEADVWKKRINETKSWAYKEGHTEDYKALDEIGTKLKGETDHIVKSVAPDAMPAWEKADKLNASLANDFGRKSNASKLANDEKLTAEQAEAQLMGNGPGAHAKTERLATAFKKLRANQGFEGGEELANQFGESMGNTSRLRANELASKRAYEAESVNPGTGEQAYRNKLNLLMAQSQPQMQAIEGLATQSQQGLNQAVIDSVNAVSKKAGPSILSQAANKLVGKIPVVGPASDMIINAGGKAIDFLTLKNARDAAVRNSIASATPEEAEIMYRMNQNSPYSAMIASQQPTSNPVPDNTPTGASTPSVAPSVQPMPTAPATVQPEPVQHAQTAHKQEPELNHGTTTFYRAISHAETGGESNRFIFTKAHDKSTTDKSSAYGPAQLTTRTARGFYKQHPEMFTREERDYLDRFIEQGSKMLRSEDHDQTYGYGAPGVLGGADNRKLYFRVVHKMMDTMIKKNGGSYEKTLREWRYGDPNADIDSHDPGYAKKVRAYFTKHL